MTIRSLGIGLLFLAAAAGAVPVQAGCVCEFFYGVSQDVKRRQCWPRPFVCADRQAAREPFALMIANGWEQQNMLAAPHFEQGSGQLTEAGRLKVIWIVNEAPEQHRTIFVHRGATPEETAQRMASVQQLLAQAAPAGPTPGVIETNRPEEGYPAARIDRTMRDFEKAMPEPKLEKANGSVNGGGSGK